MEGGWKRDRIRGRKLKNGVGGVERMKSLTWWCGRMGE